MGNNTVTNLVEQKRKCSSAQGQEEQVIGKGGGKYKGKKRRPCTHTSIFVSFKKKEMGKTL